MVCFCSAEILMKPFKAIVLIIVHIILQDHLRNISSCTLLATDIENFCKLLINTDMTR